MSSAGGTVPAQGTHALGFARAATGEGTALSAAVGMIADVSAPPDGLFPTPDTSSMDPIGRTLYDSLAVLDEKLETVGWDQPASLWLAMLETASAEEGVTEVGVAWRTLDLQDTFCCPNPVEALGGVTRRFASRSWQLQGLVAAMFVAESWMVSAGENGLGEDVRRDADVRRLHTRPDREEVRVLTCVDTTGGMYMLISFRDRSRAPIRIAEPRATPGKSHTDGNVVAHLRTLVSALTAEPA